MSLGGEGRLGCRGEAQIAEERSDDGGGSAIWVRGPAATELWLARVSVNAYLRLVETSTVVSTELASTACKQWLLLDEDYQGLGQDPVVRHCFSRRRSLHRGHDRVHVGHVHQHSDASPVRRIDERSNVRHPQRAEELLP